MTVLTDQRASQALARRLRSLRVDAELSQKDLATAFRVSAPSISAWENGLTPALPPEARLHYYARLFCRDRVADGLADPLHAPLTADEDTRRAILLDELLRLRGAALLGPAGTPSAGSARRFWQFPDGAQVRIICGETPAAELRGVRAADPWDPGHLAALALADLDALVELFGHVRAENPGADVRFLSQDRVVGDDLTGHVVVLGPAASWGAFREPAVDAPTGAGAGTTGLPQTAFDWFVRRLELPIGVRVPVGPAADPYGARFVVTQDVKGRPSYRGEETTEYRPRFLQDPARPTSRLTKNDRPQLEYDVALLARQANPMNLSASLTFCSGLFARGSFGAVRALTDANLRAANESWLDRGEVDRERFWLLLRVPVFQGANGAETVTPDLSREFHVLAHG